MLKYNSLVHTKCTQIYIIVATILSCASKYEAFSVWPISLSIYFFLFVEFSTKKNSFSNTLSAEIIAKRFRFFLQLNKNHFDHNERTMVKWEKTRLVKDLFHKSTNKHIHMWLIFREEKKKGANGLARCRTRAKADFAMSTFDFYVCVSACLIHGNTQQIRWNVFMATHASLFSFYIIHSRSDYTIMNVAT